MASQGVESRGRVLESALWASALLLMACLLQSCAHGRAEALAAFAHSSGGPAPIVIYVSLHSDGVLELRESGRTERARVHPRDAAEILARFDRVIALLPRYGYPRETWCCDRETISISTRSMRVTIPTRSTSSSALPDSWQVQPHVRQEIEQLARYMDTWIVRVFRRTPIYAGEP